MTNDRDWAFIKDSDRQGSGLHLGSASYGLASMTALVTATSESKSLLMGPITEGMCSWPSVDTETP
jgi:hypothetical protein